MSADGDAHSLKLRHRISVRLYLAVGGAVTLTLVASLVGWMLLNRVGEVQSHVTERSIPDVIAAFRLARTGRSLLAATPRLTGASTREELQRVSDSIGLDRESFEAQLTEISDRQGDSLVIGNLATRSQAILQNLDEIEATVHRQLDLAARRNALREEFTTLQDELDRILTHALDDQLFYMATGYTVIDASPALREQYFSMDELQRFRYLSELVEGATLSTQLLESAFTIAEIGLIEPLIERFEATEVSIDRGLAGLGETALSAALGGLFEQLFDLGKGEAGGFNVRLSELRLANEQARLIATNRDLSGELGSHVQAMANTASAAALESAEATTSTINTGTNVLVGINLLSIVGASLIGIVVIGGLLTRLDLLSRRMLRMADGELTEAVEITGRDEVAEMASALEIFRKQSLEAQRLNLVEKLAEELRGKNEELEHVLEDLRKAQDQIVMGQKLAELGELTAGVAHEIRNPLNFVKNFSEVSGELVDELFEELEEVMGEEGGKLDAEQRSLVEEIRGDINKNLKRIQEHGARADRIVNDMLLMSRGDAHWQVTDLNLLIEEHARLAYHSLRASDTEFNANFDFDLDTEVGERKIIPQDLGRVFLNMISNAFHATEQKRRKLAETASPGDPPFMPQLDISSRVLDDGGVEVRIRDNGTGVTPEIREKIFNPFFTTKPPNQGTGLGLAISSDIVRQHGGTIDLESESGEFTEMILRFPSEPPEVPDSSSTEA